MEISKKSEKNKAGRNKKKSIKRQDYETFY